MAFLLKSNKEKAYLYINYDSTDVIWKDWIMHTLEQEGYCVTTEPVKNDGFNDHMHQGDKDAKYKMIIWLPAFLNRLRNDRDENEAHKNLLEGVRSRLGTRNLIDSKNNLNKPLSPALAGIFLTTPLIHRLKILA